MFIKYLTRLAGAAQSAVSSYWSLSSAVVAALPLLDARSGSTRGTGPSGPLRQVGSLVAARLGMLVVDLAVLGLLALDFPPGSTLARRRDRSRAATSAAWPSGLEPGSGRRFEARRHNEGARVAPSLAHRTLCRARLMPMASKILPFEFDASVATTGKHSDAAAATAADAHFAERKARIVTSALLVIAERASWRDRGGTSNLRRYIGFAASLRLATIQVIQQPGHTGNDGHVGDVEDVPVEAQGMQREESPRHLRVSTRSIALPMAPPMIRPRLTAINRLVAPRASHIHSARRGHDGNRASISCHS